MPFPRSCYFLGLLGTTLWRQIVFPHPTPSLSFSTSDTAPASESLAGKCCSISRAMLCVIYLLFWSFIFLQSPTTLVIYSKNDPVVSKANVRPLAKLDRNIERLDLRYFMNCGGKYIKLNSVQSLWPCKVEMGRNYNILFVLCVCILKIILTLTSRNVWFLP